MIRSLPEAARDLVAALDEVAEIVRLQKQQVEQARSNAKATEAELMSIAALKSGRSSDAGFKDQGRQMMEGMQRGTASLMSGGRF